MSIVFLPDYIDPGSGSIIFQAIVGGLMAAGLFFRTGWRRVKGVFKRDAGAAPTDA